MLDLPSDQREVIPEELDESVSIERSTLGSSDMSRSPSRTVLELNEGITGERPLPYLTEIDSSSHNRGGATCGEFMGAG